MCVCVYTHTHTYTHKYIPTFIWRCCRPVLSRFSLVFLGLRVNSVLVLQLYVTLNASHTALLHLTH